MKLLSLTLSARRFRSVLPTIVALLFTARAGAATTNGHVVVWGTNYCFQPAVPASLTNINAIAAGNCFFLALRSDGTLVGWGDDQNPTLMPPAGLAGVCAIAAGAQHALALKTDGTVVGWGYSDVQQTNTGWLSGVKAIAAGDGYSMALLSNGTMYAWGNNGYGQCNGNGLSSIAAIAAGADHSLALTTSGGVIAWGRNSYGQSTVPAAVYLGTVVALASGNDHSLALRNNGTIEPWGRNTAGQCNVTDLTGVAAIAAGQNHSLVLLSNHIVVVRGNNDMGQANIPAGLTNVAAIATRLDASLALVIDPPVVTTQPVGQTNMAGATITINVAASGSAPFDFQWRKDATNITAATNATYTITNAQLGHIGNYDVVVANVMGSATSAVARLLVNSPPFITNQPSSQTLIGGSNAVASFTVGAGGTAPLSYQWFKDTTNKISGSNAASYSITNLFPANAGSYSVVVTNLFGSATSAPAVLVVNMKPVITSSPQSVSVTAGAGATFNGSANYASGYQWCKGGTPISGANSTNYLINSAQTNDAGNYTLVATNSYGSDTSAVATLTVSVPVSGPVFGSAFGQDPVFNGSDWVFVTPPAGLGNAVAISLGLYHDLALLSDNTVLGWGDNSFGQAASGQGNVTNISAGGRHSLALLSTTNRPIAWGANDLGQANVPATATNVIAVAAGWNHSLALRRDGTVVGWGTNNAGQATAPPSATNLVAIAAGSDHSLGLRNNGTVIAWGDNSYGQARPPASVTNAAANVIAIAAGQQHSMALRGNGTVVCWGHGQFDQTNVPPGLTNVMAIAAGANHCVALKRDGTVTGWGQNSYDQITFPTNLFGVFAIAAGGDRTLVLLKRHAVLLPPHARAGGGITLLLANTDGNAADASQFPRLVIRATTNLAANLTNWISYTTGFLVTNGLIRWDDTNATGLPRRFYRLGETP